MQHNSRHMGANVAIDKIYQWYRTSEQMKHERVFSTQLDPRLFNFMALCNKNIKDITRL